MRNKAIIALIVFFVSSLSISAATKPKDVYGWYNLHWGMTGQEVISSFSGNLKQRNIRQDEMENMYSGLELRGISIGGARMRASLWMGDRTNKLKRIVFIPQEQPKQYEWASTFISIEKYLVDQYGHPTIENTSNDPGTSADRKWIFPSTEIELSYLRLDDSELLLLVFSQTNIED